MRSDMMAENQNISLKINPAERDRYEVSKNCPRKWAFKRSTQIGPFLIRDSPLFVACAKFPPSNIRLKTKTRPFSPPILELKKRIPMEKENHHQLNQNRKKNFVPFSNGARPLQDLGSKSLRDQGGSEKCISQISSGVSPRPPRAILGRDSRRSGSAV